MRNVIYVVLALVAFAMSLDSCDNKKKEEEVAMPVQDDGLVIKGDSMIYGLACDGSSDSTLVLWCFKGDPISISCIDAKQAGKVFGKPEIGDWIGVMVDPTDSTEATQVINLDELKGTWSYPVMPVMKELQNMSKRMQKRIMARMNDSVKENFLIPREYGFVLKRSHNAAAVGRVYRSNTLEDDSPVIYPKVKNYKKWYTCNGKLLMVSGDVVIAGVNDGKNKKTKDVVDTMEFVSMQGDSLILSLKGVRYGFHRQESAATANAAAQAAERKNEKKLEEKQH